MYWSLDVQTVSAKELGFAEPVARPPQRTSCSPCRSRRRRTVQRPPLSPVSLDKSERVPDVPKPNPRPNLPRTLTKRN